MIVAAAGVLSLRSANDATERLAQRDVVALDALSQLEGRFNANAHEVVRHLYVFDGDLASQDRTAAVIAANKAIIKQQLGVIEPKLHSPAASAAFAAFVAARTAYVDQFGKALAASRQETVDGVEERTVSRAIYTQKVAPALTRLSRSMRGLRAAIVGQVHAQEASASTAASRGSTLVLLVGGLALLFAAGLAVLITRSITRPVARLVQSAEAIADGDLRARAGIESSDEIGRLGAAFDRMAGEVSALVRRIQEAAQSLSASSQEMAATSEQTGSAVNEIATAVGEVAVGAQRQVHMLGAARGAAEGMAEIAGTSAVDARSTAEAADAARELAGQGVASAAEASAAMQAVRASSGHVKDVIDALGEKSARIGGIVETITGLAAQTNLLALNAAIEAARAGEQGRGFAVVAEEVRHLAEESQRAAATIAGLIGEIQAASSEAVAAVDEGGARIEGGASVVDEAREAFVAIGTSVDDMSGRIAQIAAAAEAIAGDAERVQRGVDEVAGVAEQSSAAAQQVSAATQETSASSEEIAAGAQELARTAEELSRSCAASPSSSRSPPKRVRGRLGAAW